MYIDGPLAHVLQVAEVLERLDAVVVFDFAILQQIARGWAWWGRRLLPRHRASDRVDWST